jgi:phosphate starvation-inducible protein PhoH and related proteins
MTLSKRQRRALRKNGVLDQRDPVPQRGMQLQTIVPKTRNQQRTFDAYDDEKNILLHGSPGTGKTFLSLYLSLYDLFNYSENTRDKIVIIRSAQPSKEIGFLPGKETEKLANYELPYKGICSELFRRGDAYEILKLKNMIEFQSTSFLRGTTIDNAIVILDEAQNLSYMELKTVLTRIGDNTRIIICGDIFQDDLTSARYNQTSGLSQIMKIFNRMESVEHIEFGIDDIVRSGFVREFIVAEHDIGCYNTVENIRVA